MKILVICQHYAPEPFRITDICEEMAKRGHTVTVVTGVPNYPEGVIYPGYEKGKRRDEIIGGVKVHRCFTIPRKTGAFYRLLNYFSYALSSSMYISRMSKAYDVVFINQLSPVMMAYAGIKYSKKNKVPAIMYCLDLWPESLLAGGIGRGSLIYRIFHRLSKGIYTKMDEILVTSQCFQDYLYEEFGVSREKMEYLPQYAEALFEDVPAQSEKSEWNFVFAGNIGDAQSVETILYAAKEVQEVKAKFHIVGGGSELGKMQALAKELAVDNVFFYGRRPLEEMPAFYGMADAMLITLKADPVLSLTLPGKMQTYMAAGKPVIGAINGETASVIEESGCGFCGPAEDANALAANLRSFINSNEKEKMANNARKYYKEQFDKEHFICRLEELLAKHAGCETTVSGVR